MNLLQLCDIHVRFGAVDALRGVDIDVPRGGCVGIIGESGSGKTTVANVIMGLVAPWRGLALFDGRSLEPRPGLFADEIQIVFQDPNGSLDPRMAVWDIITEGLAVKGVARERRRSRAHELAQLVGLEGGLERFPHAFSGGQRQRIAIARALALEPRLVVLDEPTSALDVLVQAQILNLLLDLQERLDLTYVLISHDMAVIAHMCQHIVVMRNGEVVEKGTAERVLSQPSDPYTQKLLASIPLVGEKEQLEL